MSVIVSGGAGFVGINFIKEIYKYEKEIYLLDNFSNGSKEWIRKFNIESKIKTFNIDLSNYEITKQTLKKIIDEIKTKPKIWHFAANSDIPSGIANPRIDLKDTFMTTFNLLEGCKEFNIKSFYFASSSAIYGDHKEKALEESSGPLMPISNYGAMKLASEAQCFSYFESFLDELRIFRFPNVVGVPATHGILIDLIKKLAKDPKKLNVLGNGSQQKSYLHISDLIEGMIHISSIIINKNENPIFNLGPKNDFVKVKWIAEEVVRKVSPSAQIIYGHEDRGWVGDIPKFLYNTSKANRLGWTPKLNSKQSILKAITEITSLLEIQIYD